MSYQCSSLYNELSGALKGEVDFSFEGTAVSAIVPSLFFSIGKAISSSLVAPRLGVSVTAKPVGSFGFFSGLTQTAIVVISIASRVGELVAKNSNSPKLFKANASSLKHLLIGSIFMGAITGMFMGKFLSNRTNSEEKLTIKDVVKLELGSNIVLFGSIYVVSQIVKKLPLN
ncbi:MAG: hypothetical protein P0S95_06225 [Rhabdochlamydiaceae bacterium]|nr:hypothetical protein [Candidatus Amphrikana amoebophyrae]